MKRSLRALVRARAERRCEYCRLHETDQPLFPFHIEHIIAKKHRGDDNSTNLAWACHECNLAKSSNLSGRDPITARVIVLFNPRRQRWERHFS
jgi:5-methylcytosine-specific restriction endonuclease McrA